MVDFRMEEKPSCTLHSHRKFTTLPTIGKKCSRTYNLCPLHCCAFSRRGIPSRSSSHAQDFAGFTHAVVFFCGFVNNVGGSFPHGLIGGSMLLLLTQHARSCGSRSPMISCRRPFHAQELCAVYVILTRLLSYSGTNWGFPML